MWAKPKKMLLTYADAYNFALDRLAMRDHSSLSEEEERERAEEFARKEVPKLLKKYQTEPRKGKAALSRKLASRGFTGVCLYAALAVYDEMEEEIPNKEEEGSF